MQGLLALVGVLVGGGAGFALAYRLLKGQFQGPLDAVRQAQASSEAQAKEARERGDVLNERLREAEAARARLEGVAAILETLREDLAAKNEENAGLTQRVTTLTGQLSQAKTEVEESRRRAEELLAQKDAQLGRELEAKDREVQRLLDAEREGHAARIAQMERHLEEQKALLAEAEGKLKEAFESLSAKALDSATERFLRLANENFEKASEQAKGDLERRRQAIDQLVKPLGDTLEKLEKQSQEMEQKRVSAFDAIERSVKMLSDETDQLANALRKPTARGAWGEMQLQVILENAGLIEGEHFTLQHSTDGEEGRLRTDVVIKLPKDRLLVIDSKAPLDTYWDGMNAPDEATRTAKFASHAKQVREHIRRLADKRYWSRYDGTPDCVVMFIPTEGAYQAAFEADSAALREAHSSRVYVANPMTVISMVHVAAYVLNEEKLRQNANEVRQLGAELYARLCKFGAYVNKMGASLQTTVNHFNDAVGSFDARVVPQARRMRSLGAGTAEDVPAPKLIESSPRPLASPEARELPMEGVFEELEV